MPVQLFVPGKGRPGVDQVGQVWAIAQAGSELSLGPRRDATRFHVLHLPVEPLGNIFVNSFCARWVVVPCFTETG